MRLPGGDVEHFNQLLDDARAEAAEETGWLLPTARSSAAALAERAAPQPPSDPHPASAGAVMKTFSKVLTEDHTVEDGRARLLRKLAEQQTSPARRTGTTRPRPRSAPPAPTPTGSLLRAPS